MKLLISKPRNANSNDQNVAASQFLNLISLVPSLSSTSHLPLTPMPLTPPGTPNDPQIASHPSSTLFFWPPALHSACIAIDSCNAFREVCQPAGVNNAIWKLCTSSSDVQCLESSLH